MSSPSNPNNGDFNILSEILEQVRETRARVDIVAQNQVTRSDLFNYVLKEVFDVEIKRLDEKDKKQQEYIEGLQARELTQGQRILTYFSAIVGVLGGTLGIIKLFIR